MNATATNPAALFPACPDWTGTDAPHAYGIRAFQHFDAHGPAQMSDDAIDRALSASVTLVTAKDCHPPVREHWQALRARLRRTSDARQRDRTRRLAALAEMLAQDSRSDDDTDQDDDRRDGGAKVPSHPPTPKPPTPDALPLPVTRPAAPALPFTL